MSKFRSWVLHNMQGSHEDPAEQVSIIHSTNGLHQLMADTKETSLSMLQ